MRVFPCRAFMMHFTAPAPRHRCVLPVRPVEYAIQAWWPPRRAGGERARSLMCSFHVRCCTSPVTSLRPVCAFLATLYPLTPYDLRLQAPRATARVRQFWDLSARSCSTAPSLCHPLAPPTAHTPPTAFRATVVRSAEAVCPASPCRRAAAPHACFPAARLFPVFAGEGRGASQGAQA